VSIDAPAETVATLNDDDFATVRIQDASSTSDRDHDHFLKVRPTMTRTRPIDLIEAPSNLGLKPPKAATEPGTRSQVIAAKDAPSVLIGAAHALVAASRSSLKTV